MLLLEHSAILSTFIKLPIIIKIFILSIFEWLFYTGFTVNCGSTIVNAVDMGKKQKRNDFIDIQNSPFKKFEVRRVGPCYK